MKTTKPEGNPFFSIVMPTYNRGLMIGASIDSVIGQTFHDWELIIIDDGSTDNTKEIVNSYEKKEGRIKYHYQNNAERSVARNNGIGKSQGKYVCFIDSDDLYEEDNLEKWHSFIDTLKFPEAMMFGSLKYIQGGVAKTISHELKDTNVCEFLLCNPIVPSRVCIAKTILDEITFEPTISIGEDVTLWLKIATKFPIIEAGHIAARYIVHQGNSTAVGSGSSVKMLNSFKWFFNQYPLIRKQIDTKIYRSYISEIHVNVAKYYQSKKRVIVSLKHLIKALVLAPFHQQTKHRFFLIKESLFLWKKQ